MSTVELGEVAGVVLAGGRGRRMGEDKALLALEGRTLLERAVTVLRSVTAMVMVVGPPERRPWIGEAQLVSDAYPGAGPLGAIATALEAAPAPRLLVVGCDMPFLSASLLDRLISRSQGWDVTVPMVAGRTHQLHAVYAQSALPAIQRQLASGNLKIDEIFTSLRVQYVSELDIPMTATDRLSFWNVNTPEDWALARHLAAERR